MYSIHTHTSSGIYTSSRNPDRQCMYKCITSPASESVAISSYVRALTEPPRVRSVGVSRMHPGLSGFAGEGPKDEASVDSRFAPF